MHTDLNKYTSKIMRRIGMIQMHRDNASDKIIRTKAEVEVDI